MATVLLVAALATVLVRTIRKAGGRRTFETAPGQGRVARGANELAARALSGDFDDLDATRSLRAAAGDAGDRFTRYQAAATLGAAQKVVAATPAPGRRAAHDALDVARRAIFADLEDDRR